MVSPYFIRQYGPRRKEQELTGNGQPQCMYGTPNRCYRECQYGSLDRKMTPHLPRTTSGIEAGRQVALFNVIVAGTPKLADSRQYGVFDILVDESADKRDTIVRVLLREELMGASCNSN